MAFEFRCSTCGEIHKGMPGYSSDAPLTYYSIPVAERASRCLLESETCVIDGNVFLVRGCIEIPVRDEPEALVWGVWASLSEPSFRAWSETYQQDRRSHVGPFFGWLNAWLKPYPDTVGLKTRVHLRDHGQRPWIELEPTDHPLAVEQRNGISIERVAEIYSIMQHGTEH